MSADAPDEISLQMMRQVLSVPLLCDALDAAGYTRQSPRLPIVPVTLPGTTLIGRCRPTLWADMARVDPRPYDLGLQAGDSGQPDDALITAAAGSARSGIRGEARTAG